MSYFKRFQLFSGHSLWYECTLFSRFFGTFISYFAPLYFIVPSGGTGLAAAIKNTTEDVLQTTYKTRWSCLRTLLPVITCWLKIRLFFTLYNTRFQAWALWTNMHLHSSKTVLCNILQRYTAEMWTACGNTFYNNWNVAIDCVFCKILRINYSNYLVMSL